MGNPSGNNQFTFKTIHDRFMSYVETIPECGCWIWTGSTNGDAKHPEYDYGKISTGTKRHPKLTYAHRIAYELFRCPIPEGMDIDHLCRVRLCVNPWHLEPVTFQENMRRGNSGKHQAARTHCPQGHPYNPENTMIIAPHGLRKSINRMCRECCRTRRRAYYYSDKGDGAQRNHKDLN
jgi:hypothetical protein